jgi:hypothetical protein
MKTYSIHTVIIHGTIQTTTEYYVRMYPLIGYNKTSPNFSSYEEAELYAQNYKQ